MENLLPSLELDPFFGDTFVPASCFEKNPDRVWLEIGFGGGEHLAWQAKANPEIGFIGCEPYMNGVAKLLGHVSRGDLNNVRLFRDDARLLVARLPEKSIDRVFVLFPDPWPKVRHRKRRIISDIVLDHLARALTDEAELRISTDDPGYLEWILFHLRSHADFSWAARTPSDWRQRPSDWPRTRYQEKAQSAGRTPVFLTYKRVARIKKE